MMVKRVLAEIVVGMEDGGCIAEVIVCDGEEGGGWRVYCRSNCV